MRIPLSIMAILSIVVVSCALMACSGRTGVPYDASDDNKAGEGVVKPEDMKAEAPKDGMIYVWSLPNYGHQSIVVLNVVDGNTVDAAYLVPVRIRLKGTVAPALDEKGGKEARQAVDKLIGGQLRAAQLWGVGEAGIIADFWIPADKEGDKGQWASETLLKLGVVKQAK